MDLGLGIAETMKNIVAKGIQTEMGSPYGGTAGSGYVTEKLYMLLQIYLQNKGWNHSVDLLPLFAELKEASMLPNASYLQMMASRITLDSQGRLVLRENGKIILPFEHFANAVMLKHINGPHGLHLGLEATLRAVMDSYTIGRENYGMEKEFIMEVVNNCPNPACRYYKTQLDMTHNKPTYLPDPPAPPVQQSASSSGVSVQATVGSSSAANMTAVSSGSGGVGGGGGLGGGLGGGGGSVSLSGGGGPVSLGGGGGGITLGGGSGGVTLGGSSGGVTLGGGGGGGPATHDQSSGLGGELPSIDSSKSSAVVGSTSTAGPPPPPQLLPAAPTARQQQQIKLNEFLKSNLESLESITSANKDLLAVHNGSWMQSDAPDGKHHVATSTEVGQEKIVRAFAEIMKNMNRMKTCVRPAMCKPYGKQSESLQKTLMDTIQLVQSLRSFLPPPHIAVSSWKNEDKHRSRRMEET